MNVDSIKKIFHEISKKAKSENAQVELLIDSGESLSLSAQKAQIEKFDQKTFRTAGFRVLYSGQQGYASTEKLSDEALTLTFAEALQNAKDLSSTEKRSQEVDWSFPSGQSETKIINELDFGEQGTLAEKMQLVLDLEKISQALDSRISIVPYSVFSEGSFLRTILNSQGMERSYQERHFMSYSAPLAKDGTQSKMLGEMRVSRRFKDLKANEIAQCSVNKATSLLGATKLESGNYPVLIDRNVAQDFFELLKPAFSAKRIFEKKSFLTGKLDQRIAADFLSICDDPLDLRGGGVRPFDSEGTASQKVLLIENGILKRFLTNTEFAAKMNLPLTAHASRSPTSEMQVAGTTFVFSSGKESFESLLQKYPRIIHVVDLSAFHSGFNGTTGDFSLPGQGFLFENGVKIKPVDQFVMSGNIFELLQKIVGLSNRQGPSGRGVICSDVLVSTLSFA